MKRLPVFASLSAVAPHGPNRTRLNHIRNTTLQSATTFRFGGWNRTNLLNAVRTRAGFRVSSSVLEIIAGNDLDVYLDSRERLPLEELACALSEAKYPLNLLFLLCSPHQRSQIHSTLLQSSLKSVFAVVSDYDPYGFLFALGLETSHWWELKSVYLDQVTFQYIASCVHRLADNLAFCIPTAISLDIIKKFDAEDQIAWVGGNTYASADVDKFKDGARSEQLDDTIKRVFDASAHPRHQHLPSSERLISSQGLFWLAELDRVNDVRRWVFGTRFFAELVPAQSFSVDIPKVIYVPRDGFKADVFLSSLVEIPAGRFIIGSANTTIGSEPPTALLEVEFDRFWIMKQPVTNALWVDLLGGCLEETSYLFPKTHVNYFEAESFAIALLQACRRSLGQVGAKLLIQLPTESEWEVAARGPCGTNYPWGNHFDPSRCNCEMVHGCITPVGQFSPIGDSIYGCQDMAGNVREWTRSYAGTRGLDWTDLQQSHLAEEGDIVIESMSRLVIRGGSYSYSSECVQGWVRNTQIASRSDGQTGFRLVTRGL